ncbi:MAG: carboxypeptidase-like regulatory domain-containing protein [Bacteroidota bacterium]
MSRLTSIALVFLLLVTLTTNGQDISFKIIDENDGAEIPFATVYFPSVQVGYSSNSEGFFTLRLTNIDLSDSLVVSSLGYLPAKIKVGQAQASGIVRLKADLRVLDEVIISAKRESANSLVKDMDRFLKNNLGKDPYFLYAFYKETLQHKEEYIGYTEAYGVFHISGYQPSFNRKNELFSYDLAQWKNIRRSNYSAVADCDTVKKAFAIGNLLKVKSEYLFDGPLNNPDDFEFAVDSVFSNNGTEILVVKFSSNQEKYTGEFWVDETNNGLLLFQVYDEHINEKIGATCNPPSSGDFTLTFLMLDGEYFINTISLTTFNEAKNLREELVIRGGEFRKNDVMKFNYDQRVVIYNEMVNPLIMYDQHFWDENASKVALEIREDLASDEPLTDQFFKFNGKRIIPLPEEFNTYEELYKKQDLFQMFMLNSDF